MLAYEIRPEVTMLDVLSHFLPYLMRYILSLSLGLAVSVSEHLGIHPSLPLQHWG